jgi:hypothetical protein
MMPLLRPRREGPSGRRAAEQRDELAPMWLIELHPPQRAVTAQQNIELPTVRQDGTPPRT